MSKAQWRSRLLARRRAVAADVRARAALELLRQAMPLPDLQPPAAPSTRGGGQSPTPGGLRPTMAAYVSMGTEIPMRPLLQELMTRGFRVLVPRLGSGLDVGWSVLDSLTGLRTHGAHRPQEPATPVLGPRALHEAGVMIVPALAVDRHGRRLGRGGGWYDRALPYRRPGAPVIAVCWPWEFVTADLPVGSHDVPVTAALTPDGFTPLAPGDPPRVRHDARI